LIDKNVPEFKMASG